MALPDRFGGTGLTESQLRQAAGDDRTFQRDEVQSLLDAGAAFTDVAFLTGMTLPAANQRAPRGGTGGTGGATGGGAGSLVDRVPGGMVGVAVAVALVVLFR
jgi:hypothetical protein